MSEDQVMEVGATQLVGSQGQQPVLLHQPPFEVVGRNVFKRPGRGKETEYLVHFIGAPDEVTVPFPRNKILDAPGGREAVAAFEADLARIAAGGLENADGDDDLGMMDADSLPGPHAYPTTQQPWTQQPSEAQLPQTQQHSSALPLYEPSQQNQEHLMPPKGSRRHDELHYPDRRQMGSSAGAVPRRSKAGGARIVNGLPTSLWEDPPLHPQRQGMQYHPAPVPAHAQQDCAAQQGMQAPQKETFAYFAAQSSQQPARSPVQQEPRISSQAPQQRMRSVSPQMQQQQQPPSNVFGLDAAQTVPQQETRSVTPQMQQQPRNVFESFAAQAAPQQRMHYVSPQMQQQQQPQQPSDPFGFIAGQTAPQQELRSVSPQIQPQPRDVFASFAAATRRAPQHSTADGFGQGHVHPGRSASPMDRPVHGVTLRTEYSPHQYQQQGAPSHVRSAQDPGEPSFAFPPVPGALLTQQPSLSPESWRNAAPEASAQQPPSGDGRPVPASFHSMSRWDAHPGAFSNPQAQPDPMHPRPVQQPMYQPQQQAATPRQPGQSAGLCTFVIGGANGRSMHTGAAGPSAAHPSRAAHPAQEPAQEQVQDRPVGFYDSFVNSLTASMPAAARSYLGIPAPRNPPAAPAAQVPSQRAAQVPAGSAVRSTAGGMPAAASTGPVQAHEPVRPDVVQSSSDAAETDAAEALAALRQEAELLIRERTRPDSAAQPQGEALPYVAAPAWGVWAPAVNQIINSRGLGGQTAATGQAAHEVEDPIEESPTPLQERPEAAAQEIAGSPKLGRGKQRKQLRKIHTANESDAEQEPPKKLPRLAKKVAIALIEQAAGADDSETGSSAERFIEQASRQKPAAAQPGSEAEQVPEQPGAAEQVMPVVAGAEANVARGSMTPVPDSTASEPESSKGDDVPHRLSEKGWNGAIIKRAKHTLGITGEDDLQLQILWPDAFSTWVDKFELHSRPHTHLSLIQFYESKTRPK